MSRCVVFGADGFLGSHICEALLADGQREVVAFDISREFVALAHLSDPRLERRTGDFLDEHEVASVLRKGDQVVHLVSTSNPTSAQENMVYDVQSNLIGTLHLLEACVAKGVERVLFASSGGTVYGIPDALPVPEDHKESPISAYGVTKLAIEKYCKLFHWQRGLRCVILRLANPFGPRHHGTQQGIIPVFVRRLRDGLPLEVWGDGEVVRDYVYVEDAAKAFVAARAYQGEQQVFNIGAGEGVSVRRIITLLGEVSGKRPQVHFTPGRVFDVPAIWLDNDLARRELDWSPVTSLRQGLAQTWERL